MKYLFLALLVCFSSASFARTRGSQKFSDVEEYRKVKAEIASKNQTIEQKRAYKEEQDRLYKELQEQKRTRKETQTRTQSEKKGWKPYSRK